MMRIIGASALAFGAVLMFNGTAPAGDDTPSAAWTTMTLGGQGTVADASAEDIEYTAYRGGYYGGYRGGYYGGFRGGYYGGYRGYYGGYRGGYYGGGYRGYYGGFRGYPYYAGYRGWGGWGYGWNRPWASTGFYRPWGYGWYRPWGVAGLYRPWYSGYYGGVGYCGISGSDEDVDAPVVTLNLAVANNPFTPRERDAAPAPVETNLPVSLTKPTSPYTYKAYGEK